MFTAKILLWSALDRYSDEGVCRVNAYTYIDRPNHEMKSNNYKMKHGASIGDLQT